MATNLDFHQSVYTIGWTITLVGYEQSTANQPSWKSDLPINTITFYHQKSPPTKGRSRYVDFLCLYSYKYTYISVHIYKIWKILHIYK